MSIVIKNKSNVHVVDIQDENGNLLHQLKFNLDDVNLTGRVLEFYNNAQEEIAKMQAEQEEASKQVGEFDLEAFKKLVSSDEEGGEKIPEPLMNFYNVQKKGFATMRKLLDDFLGAGTCEKIFGDIDSYDLFEQFIDGLIPEFEKMGVKIEKMKKDLYKKYSDKDRKVLK